MTGAISTIRWTLAAVFSVLFLVIVFATLIFTTVSTVATDAAYAKSWVKSSGIYDHVLEVALSAVTSESNNSAYVADMQARLTTPGSDLNEIASKILVPLKLEQNVNVAIDAIYAWMNGTTERPDFNLSLVPDRDTFTQLVVVLLKERVRALPLCPDTANDGDFDPVSGDCQPVNYDFTRVDQYVAAHSADPEFQLLFQKSAISSTMLPITQQNTNDVQNYYRVASWLPVVAMIVAAIWGLMLWIIIPVKRRGAVLVGLLIAVPAAILSFAGLTAERFFDNLYGTTIQIHTSASISLLLPYFYRATHAVYSDLAARFTIVSLVAFAIGLILIISGMVLRRKHQAELAVPERPSLISELEASK